MIEKLSRPVQISLGVFILVVLIFVVLSQQGVSTTTTESSGIANTAEKTLSPLEAQKQFLLIQEQVKAGTLSEEEANKQISALGAQVMPPPLPPETQKKIDAKKALQ